MKRYQLRKTGCLMMGDLGADRKGDNFASIVLYSLLDLGIKLINAFEPKKRIKLGRHQVSS